MSTPALPTKRPNIFDLERVSGFSRSTISRAFNPGSVIKSSTRDQIMKFAQDIGYAPHAGARTIRSKRMNRWALLVPHLQNPYYAELVEACDLEARRRGTTLVLGLSHYNNALIHDLLRQWAGGETDGLILDTPGWEDNESLLEKLRARGVPMVCLHSAPAGYHVVWKNTEPSYRLAMEQLLVLGHRRIAYIGPRHGYARQRPSFLAYSKGLEKEGVALREEYLFFGTFDRRSGMEAWQQWRSLPEPPTAVLAFNDVMACGVWRAAQLDGFRIPQDLSIIGNDDIEEAAPLGLTSIRIDQASFAREIFEVLEAVRLNPSLSPQRRVLPTDLIFRNSVASPAKP
jgi:LacI family transcriptional regulator